MNGVRAVQVGVAAPHFNRHRRRLLTVHHLLEDRTIIVTGAATGIGQAFALGCTAQGANVVVVDLGPADETLAAIEAAGGRALYVRSDVSDDASTQEMARQAMARFSRVDGLVNNAAYFREVKLPPFEEIDPAIWDRIFQVVQSLEHTLPATDGPGLLGADAAPVLSRAGIALGVIDAAVHTIIIRKVTAPVLFDETPVGLRRRRTMAEGMARLEALAAGGAIGAAGAPTLDAVCTVVALDYLSFRFEGQPWLPAMPALDALSASLRAGLPLDKRRQKPIFERLFKSVVQTCRLARHLLPPRRQASRIATRP